MVLSQIPTALAKHCRSSCTTSRVITGHRREQSSAFSSLVKLAVNQTDDNDHEDDCRGNSTVHAINGSSNGNSSSRDENNLRATVNHFEASVKKLQIMNEVSKNHNGGSIVVQTTTTQVKKHMPRLEQLRNRLSKRHHEDDVKAFSLRSVDEVGKSSRTNSSGNSTRTATPKANNNSNSNSNNNNMTWRQVLAAAKEHLSNSIEQNERLLTDAYSRKHSYLRISLGERCNLRCLYCMPPEGVPLQPSEKILNADEISRLVHLFTSKGVDKVRLTGGEPLLRKDLPQIISSIAAEPTINSVGITTNGITLSRHLPTLVENGLTHANISLDTLQNNKFQEITRRNGLSQVMKAIDHAAELLPQGNVKVNCVVMKGFNDNELRDFISLTMDKPVDIRFIEWMPFNDNGWNNDRFLSYDDMMRRITSDDRDNHRDTNQGGETASMQGLSAVDLVRLEDGPNDTTKWWQAPDHVGRVGFITSMTQHFCGSCNRLRVTADGQLKVCLFGSAEVSLRDAMREGASDEDLGAIVWAALQNKHFALGGHGNAEGIKKANDNRPMTLIGG
eukprot:CAMPEP_0203670558 /NCGR_PEP_ID=MMETSP0090-20130426/6600_1 /ASSEMBLY_ACC=CAM_ASM_001088 /TAXON_ID=426623 /ORGANISM="Chaetoceros affinis, Strain CCMP159" /LENGTH=559 /DNA_ID=CAMNT_0050535445 /DNA_START=101 /DNA_END=1780 /DNA_ORIENTATION=-